MSVRSKTKRRNYLKPDVVMRLFLYDTLAIRNLTKRIQELDQKLAREFVSFNRISESSKRKITKYSIYCLSPSFGRNSLKKPDLQQQRDIARSFETEEQINRLLEARSDAISDLARQQHEMGRVR